MKPQTALKFEYSVLNSYTREQIDASRDAWIAEYEKIAAEFPQKKEICEGLILRIHRAAELLADRVLPGKNQNASHSYDDAYYEWLDELKKEEDDSLDGNFPLGNEEDMAFASPYFSNGELALIQAGCSEKIYAGYYVEYADRVLVRKGILAEVKGNWKEAAAAYAGVSTSKIIQKREYACRQKAEKA